MLTDYFNKFAVKINSINDHQSDHLYDFQIKKRNGKYRKITAPMEEYKYLLRNLQFELKAYYNPPEYVHGFIDNKNIKTNASCHLAKQKILKIDLADFFETISKQMVINLISPLDPELSDKQVDMLSSFCTVSNSVPQGFPTSPIISNLIFDEIDRELWKLAQSYSITYTRYADDMIFSTENKKIPADVYNKIFSVISNAGFYINSGKTKYKGKHRCQIITGLIVNDKISLKRNYRRNIRAILHNWEYKGYEATIEEYSAKYKRSKRRGKPTFVYSLVGRIEYVGFIYGKESKIYSGYKSKFDYLFNRDNVDSISPY